MQLDDITCLFIPTLSVFMGAIGTVKELCQNNEYESFEEEAGTAAYYNVTIHEESNEKQNEVYEEISQFYN